jgi:hypothetical protein
MRHGRAIGIRARVWLREIWHAAIADEPAAPVLHRSASAPQGKGGRMTRQVSPGATAHRQPVDAQMS